MYINTGAKGTVVVAMFIFLLACGSESNGPEAGPTNNIVVLAPDSDNNTTTGTDNSNINTGDTSGITDTQPTALFGLPQFITSECGSLEASTKVANNSLDTPTELLVGELVKGQLVPNSTTDNIHIWQISLEPGNYHLVADASVLEEGMDTIGLAITSIAPSTSDNDTLARESDFEYDLRLYEYLEIQAAQTLTLELKPSFDLIHNYSFGIFGNGSAVPSPSFERCLPINTIGLNSTHSVLFPSSNSRDDNRWYFMNLAEGRYQLDASTSSIENTVISYEFIAVDQFGQNDRFNTVSTDSVFDTQLSTRDTIQHDRDGGFWIRARNRNTNNGDDLNIEFTISEQ